MEMIHHHLISKLIICVIFLLSFTKAQHLLPLTKYNKLQTCFSITADDLRLSAIKFPVSENLQAGINITLPTSSIKYKEGLTIKTLLISGTDLKKVKLAKTFKFCDEYSSEFCPISVSPNEKSEQGLVPLDELIEMNGSDLSVLQSVLDPNSNDESKHFINYPITKSGVYCFRYEAIGGPATDPSGKHDLTENTIVLQYQNSFGELTLFDYVHKLSLYLYLSLAYFIFSLSFGYINIIKHLLKTESDLKKVVTSSTKRQATYSRFLIQFKMLFYGLGTALTYFFSFIYYGKLNRYGYSSEHTMLMHGFILVVTISFNCWTIYNFMLFSNGTTYFGMTNNNNNNKKQEQKVIKAITGLLLLQFSVYDLKHQVYWLLLDYKIGDFLSQLIYYELILVLFICSYWGFQTTKKLNSSSNSASSTNKSVRKKMIVSYCLVGSVVVYYLISSKAQSHDREDDVVSSISAEIFSFMITLALAYIWKDVKVYGESSSLPA